MIDEKNFLSHWLGYDRGDSFPFDLKPNGILFGLNRNENCHHHHIPFNVKIIGNIVFSVWTFQLKKWKLSQSLTMNSCAFEPTCVFSLQILWDLLRVNIFYLFIYFIYLNIDVYKYNQYNTITNNANIHLHV